MCDRVNANANVREQKVSEEWRLKQHRYAGNHLYHE